MKTILLILFPFLLCSQIKVNDRLTIPDNALHFYGSVLVCEIAYDTQTLLFVDQDESWKLFNSWLAAQIITISKEIFDKHKANPTGFGLLTDIPPNELGIHTWLMCKISFNDLKRVGLVKRKSQARRSKFNKRKYILT